MRHVLPYDSGQLFRRKIPLSLFDKALGAEFERLKSRKQLERPHCQWLLAGTMFVVLSSQTSNMRYEMV